VIINGGHVNQVVSGFVPFDGSLITSDSALFTSGVPNGITVNEAGDYEVLMVVPYAAVTGNVNGGIAAGPSFPVVPTTTGGVWVFSFVFKPSSIPFTFDGFISGGSIRLAPFIGLGGLGIMTVVRRAAS
jgi:hypothetical protein